MVDMALENAPLDEEGFTLTDRWYCEDTQTWYPAGTSIREIRNDMGLQPMQYIYELYVGDDEFVELMEGHNEVNDLQGDAREKLVKQIIEAAKTPERHGFPVSDFKFWFMGTEYCDDMWEILDRAMDDYIEIKATEIINRSKE